MDDNILLKVFKILEIFINILSYFAISFSFYFLHKSTLFHTNMVRLFKCLLIYYAASQIMRLIIALKEMEYDNVIDSADTAKYYLIVSGRADTKVYGFIRIGCIVALFASVGTIIFERLLATRFLETYEKNVSNLFFVSCLFYHLSNALITVFIIYKGMVDLKMLGVWLTFNNVAGYFALCFIHWFNRRRYCTSLVNLEKYTLSERFQLQENIRAASGIRRVSVIKFLFNIFIAAFIYTAEFYTSDFSKNLTYSILNHSINLYAFAFLFIGFKTNSKMYPDFLRKFKHRRKQASSVVVSQFESPNQQRQDLAKRIRDINGKQMIFTIEEERKVYFEQLRNGWN